MLLRALSAAALSAAICTTTLHAQNMTSESYGRSGLFATMVDPNLVLSAQQHGPQSASIDLVGGGAGEPAIVAFSANRAALPLGCCAEVLVGPPIVPILGQFDGGGEYHIEFDPTLPSLQGVTLHLQGVDVIQSGGLALSAGLSVSFGP